MSDRMPLPTNWPPADLGGPSPLPPAEGVVKQLPGIGQVAQKVAQSPNYQALQPQNTSIFEKVRHILMDPGAVFPKSWDDTANALVSKAGNTLTAGLLPAVVRKVDPSTQKYYDEQQNAHPIAAGIGGGIGLAGAMGAPVGAIGTAAKGAATAAGAGKVLASLAGGAAAATPYALAASGQQLLDTGSLTDAAKQLAWIPAGAIAEPLIGAIASKLPKVKQGIKDVLTDLQIRAAGGTGKALNQVAAGGVAGNVGRTASHLENIKSDVANLISKNSLYGKSAIKDFLSDEGQIWKTIDKQWDAAGVKASDFKQDVLQDPAIQRLLSSQAVDPRTGKTISDLAQQTLESVMTDADSAKNLASTRKILLDGMKRGFKATDHLGQIEGDVNSAIRDAIDLKFVPQDLKKEWPALLLLKKSITMHEGKLAEMFPANSATFTRMALSGMTGGAIGGATSGFDPKDPATWVPAALKTVGATAGGALLNKAISGVGNQAVGRIAGALREAMPMAGAVSENIGALGSAIGKAPAALNALSSTGGGETPPDPSLNMFQPPPTPSPNVPAMPSGAQPIPNAPGQQEAPHSASLTAPLSPKEQTQATFSNPTATKSSPTFSQKAIDARLEEKYRRYVMKYGQAVSFDDYKSAAANATHGFDAMDPATWKAMFDDSATSDKLYKGYMGIQQMSGVKSADVFNHYTYGLLRGSPRLATPDQRRQDEANTRVVAALAQMTGRPTKEIDQRLRSLAFDRSKTPKQREEALSDIIIKEGGVDVPLLLGMGLLGGPNG